MTIKDFIYGYYYQYYQPIRKPRYLSLKLFPMWVVCNALILIMFLITIIAGIKNIGWLWFYFFDFFPIWFGVPFVASFCFEIVSDKKISNMGDKYDTPEYARMHDVVTWGLVVLSFVDMCGCGYCLYLTSAHHNHETWNGSIILDWIDKCFPRY